MPDASGKPSAASAVAEIEAVIQTYFDGLYEGDVEKLAAPSIRSAISTGRRMAGSRTCRANSGSRWCAAAPRAPAAACGATTASC